MKKIKINNSLDIKQILDKSKDVSIAEEMAIMDYIYSLEQQKKDTLNKLKKLDVDLNDYFKDVNYVIDQKDMNKFTSYIVTPTGIHINKKNIKRRK